MGGAGQMLPGMAESGDVSGAGNEPVPRWHPNFAVQEFFIPVWGQVRLTASELRVVGHPAFARLADIYQLGQTFLVFRGATHRRWEHALGTLHAAHLICDALAQNTLEASAKKPPPVSGTWKRCPPLQPHEVAFVRLAALLHDVGHIAAGHTFEDELGLLDPHDADTRLTHVLDRCTWRGAVESPTLREIIYEEYADAAIAAGLGLHPSDIFLEMVSKTRQDSKVSSSQFRMQVCRAIVGDTICADLIDYLHRDAHHLGKPRPFDDRLLDYFEIRQNTVQPSDTRLVVNLRQGPEFRADAVTAIFDLLESRYQLGEVALFHRTKLTASAMLERLISEVADATGDPGWFSNQLDTLLECTDEEMVQHVVSVGHDIAKKLKAGPRKRLETVLQLGRSLRYRQLHRKLVACTSNGLSQQAFNFVQAHLSGEGGAAARLATCRALEEDFALPAGSVVIYCTSKTPHAKIARVQVLAHGAIQTLSEIDGDNRDPAGTGGLLKAQLKRFEGLWRVQVSVSQEAHDMLDHDQNRGAFKRTVTDLVLAQRVDGSEPEDLAREIAASLINNAYFDTGNKVLLESGISQGRASEWKCYPTGAPTLSSLTVDP